MALDPSQIVIYLGPTLRLDEAREVLSADYRGPVKRGDIRALLGARPAVIGIVDGEFFQNLAVSPKEILAAMRLGVTVFGASSIGALRAVELGAYGMIGVGDVFELFRRGRIDADDEVAVALSGDVDGRPVSEAMVNIRYALDQAVARGLINSYERRTLQSRMKRCYFPRRTYGYLLTVCSEIMESAEVAELRQFLSRPPDVKRRDAILMLQRIRALI